MLRDDQRDWLRVARGQRVAKPLPVGKPCRESLPESPCFSHSSSASERLARASGLL